MRKDAKLPYVRFYASDWLGGTRGMKAAEMGVYITLIALMYERCEPLPEDHRRLARQCGCTPSAFKNALDMLVEDGKVDRTRNGLWNKRVEKEFTFRAENSQQSRKAAQKRWGKDNKNNGSSMQAQCEGNAVGMPNQKPEARSHIEGGGGRAREPEAIHERCCELIGVSREKHMAYASSGTVRSWLTGGLDPEVDIYPTLTAIMAKRPGDPPGSMAYFTKAVTRAKKTREAPLPAVRPGQPARASPHQGLYDSAARIAAKYENEFSQ